MKRSCLYRETGAHSAARQAAAASRLRSNRRSRHRRRRMQSIALCCAAYGPRGLPLSKMTGTCEICGRKRKLVCDHDHVTGFVRGWVCGTCNSAIGYLDDNPELTDAASKYLRAAPTQITFKSVIDERRRQYIRRTPEMVK